MKQATRTILRSSLGVALLLATSCNQTPTEITPLPRAIGEVESVLLQVDNLAPLDTATQGVYFLWALLERNQAESLGPFFIDESGQIVDDTGAVKSQFTSDGFSIRRTLGLLITIELPGTSPGSPSGMQILSGTFVDGVADLTVPISRDIRNAAGSLRVFTPTDGPDTNETSGFWMQDRNGDPSLDTPDTTAALVYETFIDISGRSLPVGRFEVPDAADDVNQYSEELFPAPERPGEDLLRNAPEGLSFPTDISGARVTISLEGRRNDFVQRSQLVVLEAILPLGLRGGEQIAFVNRTDSFPTGKGVLF